MADNQNSAKIFEGVYFAIVQSESLDDFKANEIRTKLENNGATHCPLSSTKLQDVTHLIADTADFPAYNDAVDAFIHVVRPSWVEQSIMKKRASNPRQFSPDPCYFLSDAVIVIAEDIPMHDRESLIGGIQAMGGQHSSVMTKLVTHVVALNMDNGQCRIIREKNLRCTPVLPHWLDHCFLLGRKIREQPYRLPDPAILEHDRDGTLKYLKANKQAGAENVRGALTLEAGPLKIADPVSPSKTRKRLTVFRNHAILLGEDLNLSPDLHETLVELIRTGGGEVVSHREQADAIVVPMRRGLSFQHAVEYHKDAGSLNWLYHLINTNQWSDPMRKLLHYPTPENGIRGFEQFKISVSNYSGDARIYLENLIKAAGGTFTKTLTQENTHLITAHTMGDKVEAAREWNISVINHLWLEESYAGWTIKTLAETRFTTFPEKTNLGEVVGQTSIDRTKVEKYVFPNREPSPTRAGRLEPLEPSSSNTNNPLQTPSTSRVGRSAVDATTPANTSDKENQSSEGRGAKSRALNKLHSMAPDIALFNKELKRKGGVVYGGRKASDPDRVDKTILGSARKRSRSAEEDDEPSSDTGGAEELESTSAQKRSKISRSLPKLRFMVTTGERFGWSDDKGRRLREMGIAEVTDLEKVSKVDVLVSHKILKTPKFFGAVAAGLTIVNPVWLDAILEKGDLVDAAPLILKDDDFEAEHQFSLQQALSRAREHKEKGGLLHDMTIYCSENVTHGFDPWQKMAAQNGGRCALYKGRETRPAEKEAHGDRVSSEKPPLYLITVPKDSRVWKKFRTMATENGYKPVLVSHDWLIRVCMAQDLGAWEPEWEFGAS